MLSRRAFLAAPIVPVLQGQERMFANAEAYERFMGRWSRIVALQLIEFTGIPDRGRVLDVGSGTGALSFALAGIHPRTDILGIDPSKEFVEYATSRNSFGDRAAFEVGDAQQMRFPDSTFDASLSLLVFNFIPDPSKALREVRRVTKPGGQISAAVWDYGDGMKMLRAFWDAAVKIDPKAEKFDEKHMPLCRAGQLSALWRQERLESVHEQPLTIRMKFESFADYWEAFLLGQGPAGVYAKSLSSDQSQALRGELKRRLSMASGNSPFELSGKVWAVRGRTPYRP